MREDRCLMYVLRTVLKGTGKQTLSLKCVEAAKLRCMEAYVHLAGYSERAAGGLDEQAMRRPGRASFHHR